MGLSQKSMSPLLVPADCGTIHRTRRMVHDISCRIPGEKLDAANIEGTLIPATHPAAPLQLAAGKLVLGPPAARAATAVLGANIPRAKPGDVVSTHWSSACEVLTRGCLTRLQAATSAAHATSNQTSLCSAKDSNMRKIDAFAHILPRSYLERLERQLEKTMAPSQLDYYRQGVFSFDPVLTDLDARWRKIEPYGDYAQVLVLAVPPLEEVGQPTVAAEFARSANDEMAELVQRFGDRFAGFAAALPLSDVDLALHELERALTQLGALGAQLYTNILGVALDDPRFEPLFSRLEDAGRDTCSSAPTCLLDPRTRSRRR